MPASSGPACRVAIVGASSLRSKELRQLLEDRGFPATDIRLLDEDVAVGTLTEAGGEPVVIGAISEESFAHMRFAFFTGTSENTARHWSQAARAGATVIDLSDTAPGLPGAIPWIPELDPVLAPPEPLRGAVYRSPAPAAIVACTIAAAWGSFSPARIAIVFFQPVSERGQRGIDELESQTINLLSFKPISQEVFDAQVAFNLLGRYGASSEVCLENLRAEIARDVARYLAGRVPSPAIQLIQVPVFYSYAFSVYAELVAAQEPEELEKALAAAGIKVQGVGEPFPSNVSVAGESQAVIAPVERDPVHETGYWLWGASDNLRVAAANALRIAENLLAS